MSAGDFIDHVESYAASFHAPVLTGTNVLELGAGTDDYRVVTDGGTWRTPNVVIATGPHGVPHVPATLSAAEVLTVDRYRNATQLPSGGVLVIGASSSGVQLADELNRAGRDVVLAVGGHTRLPRTYRGHDIFWWLERTGRLARTVDTFPDPAAARREPSMQLIGRNEKAAADPGVDLVALQGRGVRLAGRFADIHGRRARFRSDLADTTATADQRMRRVLDSIDEHISKLAFDVPPDRPRPPRLQLPVPIVDLDLSREGIATILVATGYRPHHPWLTLPITGTDGNIRQNRGITHAPGVYVVGQRFQDRRDSGFIAGAHHDAPKVVNHLLHGTTAPRERARLNEEPAA
jgi:putative flavoprotein involved in K+ transport